MKNGMLKVVALGLAIAAGAAIAEPLSGEYPNKSSNGPATYTFAEHGNNVFVIHQFSVEVC